MIRPIAMGETHMECRTLGETIPVLTNLLGFEKVAESPGEAELKHPNTDWPLVVHEGGPEAPAKEMHNHYGVRVATRAEVDAAYEYLAARQAEYGLRQIGRPAYSHGSYSLYFFEPGTNGWEIECYEDVLRKEREWARLGGIRAPHWDKPYPPERFPGKGYVPQGFTHGTLACGDLKVSEDFYNRVLGLELHHPTNRVVYVKHPDTKCYVVSAVRPQWKSHSPNFRFTVVLESEEAVEKAHRWLAESGKGLGVTELGGLQVARSAAFFFLRDPDRNCWEISSPKDIR